MYEGDKTLLVCLISAIIMTPVVVVKPRGRQLAHLAPVDAQQRLVQLWLHDKPQSTQKCYRRYASSFTAFLAGVGKAIAHTTVEDMVEFSEYLHQKKLAAPTITTYMAAVKSLLSFAYKTGYIKQNPGAAIKLKKLDQQQCFTLATGLRSLLNMWFYTYDDISIAEFTREELSQD